MPAKTSNFSFLFTFFFQPSLPPNRLKEEALSALVILGFNKGEADKVISKILVTENPTLEDLIKKALKQL